MKRATLSLCLNVFPANNLNALSTAVFTHATAIFTAFRQRAATTKNPTAGLWLNNQVARQLSPSKLTTLKTQLHAAQINVVTLNAFPFATFHGQTIKQKVYQPDWSTAARLRYTQNCARCLAALLPKNENVGTLSSLPLGYAPNFTARKFVAAKKNLATMLDFLHALERQTGKRILLALEPEPDCYLDSPASTVEFFTAFFTEFSGRNQQRRKYLGVCLDTAHTAARFYDSGETLATFIAAKIPVYKVQLSTALATNLEATLTVRLKPFNDKIYLHQSAVRFAHSDYVINYPDLPAALAAIRRHRYRRGELRAHYHVPFTGKLPRGIRRAENLRPSFFALARRAGCVHFETEIYTLGLQHSPHTCRQILAAELAHAWHSINGS